MTETKIREMIADIVINGAEYEYTYKDANGDYKPWMKYKLGDGILPNLEYRKVEKWYVFDYEDNDYRIFKDDIDCAVPCVFEGTKEECEKWVKENSKKTWLEEICEQRMKYEKDYLKEESEHIYNSTKYGIKEVCKKILEEVDKKYTEELEEIIKDLGVEV